MIPQPGDTELNFISFIILLGVVQGFILTFTYFLQRTKRGFFIGLFFLVATFTILEIFLNRTGYMYYVIGLVDFSEPLQFLIAPSLYLSFRQINPNDKSKNYWWHFVPFLLYFLLFIPFYLAPNEYKQESYYFIHHHVPWALKHPYPLLYKLGNIRSLQLQFCVLQFVIYQILGFQILKYYWDNRNSKVLKLDIKEIKWWFRVNILFVSLIVLIVVVKLSYERDLGDHIIAAYFTLVIYVWMIRDLTKSIMPARKSELVSTNIKPDVEIGFNPKKAELISKLESLILKEKVYTDSLISVAKIGKLTGEPPYLVSQVINEGFRMTFYDWIAFHRIEEAKRLLKDNSNRNITIEDIAEQVGYNSKSAFNKAFKKFAGFTPSEYRDKPSV